MMWLLAITTVVAASFAVPTTLVVVIAVVAFGLAAVHAELLRRSCVRNEESPVLETTGLQFPPSKGKESI
jgi:hypothetical protein